MRTVEALGLAAFLGLCSCKDGNAPPAVKPAAKVANARPESALTTVTLSPEAEKRLGIELVAVERRKLRATLMAPGEVALPPGKSLMVNAPMAGTVSGGQISSAGTVVARGETVLRLVPLPSASDLASANIRLDAARKKRDRAEQLLKDGAGSRRALEEADAELAMAQANAGAGSGATPETSVTTLSVKSPQAGLIRDLHVGPGQAVAAGAPLFQVDSQLNLWVRTSLYVGDVAQVDRTAPARVFPLSRALDEAGFEAISVAGPPSGNPEAASEDLFYQLPPLVDADAGVSPFRTGQRVSVSVPLKALEDSLVVPWSGVLFDLHGGTWVYTLTAPNTYVRRKVVVKRVVDRWAALERGLAEGDRVVSVGAEELFGTEFGSGK